MNVPKLAEEPSVNALVYLMLQDKQAEQTNDLMALINLMRLVWKQNQKIREQINQHFLKKIAGKTLKGKSTSYYKIIGNCFWYLLILVSRLWKMTLILNRNSSPNSLFLATLTNWPSNGCSIQFWNTFTPKKIKGKSACKPEDHPTAAHLIFSD